MKVKVYRSGLGTILYFWPDVELEECTQAHYLALSKIWGTLSEQLRGEYKEMTLREFYSSLVIVIFNPPSEERVGGVIVTQFNAKRSYDYRTGEKIWEFEV